MFEFVQPFYVTGDFRTTQQCGVYIPHTVDLFFHKSYPPTALPSHISMSGGLGDLQMTVLPADCRIAEHTPPITIPGSVAGYRQVKYNNYSYLLNIGRFVSTCTFLQRHTGLVSYPPPDRCPQIHPETHYSGNGA